MNLPEGLMADVAAWHPHPRAFITISGAHLYGFPSRDSDIDLRGLHVQPLREVVSLEPGRDTHSRMWFRDGLEVDVVTHDVAKYCRLLLRCSGEILEQLTSPLIVETSPLHDELLALTPSLVCTGYARHYFGFSRGQWNQFGKENRLKPLLYTFRTLLTGIHLMRAGEVETDLTVLAAEYGPAYLPELIEAKRSAEHGGTPADLLDRDRFTADFEKLTARLETERDTSPLPDVPTCRDELNELVIRTRLAAVRE
ncbi:DNA polymerase beta superfamily protein [Actinomadura gamaensis]|uniref:DNA polymerase beta superfamily protein n=1 Tax=Actinomadura gamaensis TaxID=1763541 RepID=A0ABV9U7U6_9ACTN